LVNTLTTKIRPVIGTKESSVVKFCQREDTLDASHNSFTVKLPSIRNKLRFNDKHYTKKCSEFLGELSNHSSGIHEISTPASSKPSSSATAAGGKRSLSFPFLSLANISGFNYFSAKTEFNQVPQKKYREGFNCHVTACPSSENQQGIAGHRVLALQQIEEGSTAQASSEASAHP